MGKLIEQFKDLFPTIMFWAGFALLVLWILGKCVGLIKSPFWVEMIPYSGMAVAFGGLAFKAGKTLQKMDHMFIEIREVKADVKDMKSDITGIKSDVKDMNSGIKWIKRTAPCLRGSKCKF
ncbi:MAG: hypothetical protein ABIB71_04170 [Candidatus Woesearchaeota archaeon]